MRLGFLSPLPLCFAFFIFPHSSQAQVSPSAVGSERHLWGGVEFSNFKPDYGLTRLDGIGFWGDYFITHRIGVEGEVRLLDLNKPYNGETEKTFMGGIIGNVFQYHSFDAYAKGLLGGATFNFPTVGYGSYFAFAAGGGVEYRFLPRWKVRGEYEYQDWPSAPGKALDPNSSGLTPTGYSAGISYEIF